jgi:hypothetical protein
MCGWRMSGHELSSTAGKSTYILGMDCESNLNHGGILTTSIDTAPSIELCPHDIESDIICQ